MLYLSREDIERLVDMGEAVKALDGAFARWSELGSFNLPRRRPGGDAPNAGHVLGGGTPDGNYFGVRVTSSAIANVLLLLSVKDEGIAGVMDCQLLSEIRTGAASGVATKYLAREDSRVVGIIGSGKTAARQLEAICVVRKIDKIKVFSRTDENQIGRAHV